MTFTGYSVNTHVWILLHKMPMGMSVLEGFYSYLNDYSFGCTRIVLHLTSFSRMNILHLVESSWRTTHLAKVTDKAEVEFHFLIMLVILNVAF